MRLDVETATPEECQRDLAADPRPALERMRAGELYLASDPTISAAAQRAKALAQRYNQVDLGAADAHEQLHGIARELFGTWHESVTLCPSVQVDYGSNIHFGRDVFINYDAILLDVCEIHIGDGTLIGPRAQLLTPLHPARNHALRRAGWEYGAPIWVGENCWFGGGVTVCPGVKIGDNTVVGAGSVVTRDLPAGVLAAGSPAKVIREL